MSKFRIDMIAEEIRREADRIIREDLHDPRISGTWCITRAEVTRDLRFAKVYISVLESEKADTLLDALKGAAGYVRRGLNKAMSLRYTPELLFVRDENIAYGVRIAQVLRDIDAARPEADDAPAETADE